MRKITWVFATLAALISVMVIIGAAYAKPTVSVANHLAGTWSVTNETVDSTYSGNTAVGQVTFFADHLTVDSGGFAAVGIVAASEEHFCSVPVNPPSLKFVPVGGQQVIYVSWLGRTRGEDPFEFAQDAVITNFDVKGNEATMVGFGGCGNNGSPRISYLKRLP